jgi:AbrB family looped-hinge helix DNA binding protein
LSTAQARIDRAGRLLIPAKLRRQLDLRPGDTVILEAAGGELRLRTYPSRVREAQAIIAKHIPDRDRSLVDELIEQSRKEPEP